jgi:Tol biopolymer transport system component
VIYASDWTGVSHLYKMDLAGRSVTQLTDGAGEDAPACSKDGKSIVYQGVETDGSFPIYKLPIAGGTPQRLSQRQTAFSPIVSPEGTRVAYISVSKSGAFTVAVLSIEDGRELAEFPAPPTRDSNARAVFHWTPDGNGFAWVDIRSGASNIWVTPLDGSPARQLTHFSSGQIFNFCFSPDGKSIAIARGSTPSDVVLLTSVK